MTTSSSTNGPLVSIIMPTWNRAELILTAITSVLDQDHQDWELLVCDDGSTDGTAAVVRDVGDRRIRLLMLEHDGAAAARNAGLAEASGDLIAYLDTDNVWHPAFLSTMVAELAGLPGRHAAYARYVDVIEDQDGVRLKTARGLPFDYDRLTTKNFIDLNSVVHRRSLHTMFGGFDEGLVRQQDWDLVLKYSFLREPLYVDRYLVLYRRNAAWGQITDVHRENVDTPRRIAAKVDDYYRHGLPAPDDDLLPSLTIVSWDVCRNHFSKAYNLAECIEDPSRVQLLGFRFFDEPIFPPYADADPAFAMDLLDGGDLPDWWDTLARGVANVRGEVVYAVKPRLPSLGLALLRNHAFGTPVVVETNDLESVVTRPRAGQELATAGLDEVDPADPDLMNPYGDRWTAILEDLVPRLPMRVTHNHVLDDHFGGGAYFVRNLKDDHFFDPDRHDRDAVRREYGFGPQERIVLFGGMVRRHKGVFEILDAVRAAGPDHRLVVVGSRETPDQTRLREVGGAQLTILEPVDRNEMARLNLASDAVVLWLDPDVPASRFQMPYKLTDALAMQVPVVVDDVGDLGRFVRGGYARHAPFRDATALRRVLQELVDDRDATSTMTGRGRRLYLREFSYRGVRRELDVIRAEAMAHVGVMDVAAEFAEFVHRVRVAQGAWR